MTGQHFVWLMTFIGVVICFDNTYSIIIIIKCANLKTRCNETASPTGGAVDTFETYIVTPASTLSSVFDPLAQADMAAIDELSPSAGPVSTRPPEDEIDDDEDEDVGAQSVCLVRNVHGIFSCFNFLATELYTCRLTD